MIEQIKQLLSEATIHIQHDVNSTHISFSFDSKDVTEGPVPQGDIEAMEKAMQKAKKEVENIVEKTGAPKDKVIVASVPKTEESTISERIKEKAKTAKIPVPGGFKEPKQEDMFPDSLPKDPYSEKIVARFKELEELGWKEKGDQYVYGCIGIAITYINKTEDNEWKRCIAQIKSDQMKSRLMEEERKAKVKKANEIVQQTTGSTQGKTEVKGTLTASRISEEQRELMEMAYAVPDDDIDDIPLPIDEVQYKGEPASPKEAFDPPVVPPPPPVPPSPNTDMHLIAANPMEQMKKNSGKPYLNKAGVLIEPKKDDESKKKKLWDILMAKCKEYKMDTEGMEYDEMTIDQLEEYNELVDENIAELNTIKK